MSASESATPHLYVEALAASREEKRAISTRLFRSVLAGVELAADFLTCTAGMVAAFSVDLSWHMERLSPHPIREVSGASLAVGLFAVLLLQRAGAYRGGGSLLQIRETERAIWIPVQSVLVLLAFSLLLDMRLSNATVLIALFLIPALLILQKLAFFSMIRKLHDLGYGVDRVVVYGAGDVGKRIVPALFYSVRLGLLPIAVIEDNPALDGSCIFEMGYQRRRWVPVQRGPVTAESLKSWQASTLIVALPNLSSERRAAAVDAAMQAGLKIAFLSSVELREQQRTQPIEIDGLSLTPNVEPLASWHYEIAKRVVDVIVSTLLMALLAPISLLIALIIKLDSHGPALFTQKRVGRNGDLFKIFKFRSMYIDAPKYDFSPTTPGDPRITRIGRFLRRTSLDELPQLMNVFLGNMSLVGPRPEMPFIVENYTREHRRRLQVIPGITGMWQISADRAFLIHENIHYDLYYIRNRGFFLDIAILIHTFFFAIRRGV
jgi:exopolysaccharide biosynthesis polyprenyl glycosylphosphotransferase